MDFGQVLTTYGPLGIGWLALGWAVKVLFGKYDDVQAKRIELGEKTLAALAANTAATEAHTLAIDNQTRAIEGLGTIIKSGERN